MQPEDIAFSTDSLGKGAGVRVRWLGTAGFSLEYGDHVVLIDPYLTRASLASVVARRLRPDLAVLARLVPRADAIVVGHTHFDHALDVPAIALKTGARVFGSRSAATLCRASGVPEAQVDVVEREAGGQPVVREVGPFTLRFLPSAHARLVLGRVPAPGEIADCTDVPMRASAYRCGAVFGVEIGVAGKTLYHVGSAEFVDAHVDVRHVDLLLLCTAGWTTSRDFPERVGARLNPGAVLLSHWDDFLRPIDAPARALPAMKLPALVERLVRRARGVPVGTLPLLGDVLV